MRAIGLDYQTRTLDQFDVPAPECQRTDDVLFRVAATGICGTDRDLARFRLGRPPAGEERLVLGHEAIGQVVEAGPEVHSLAPGDWVVPMVRRACRPGCAQCARGRRDLCTSGGYTERGIMGAHGYFCEYAVDSAADLIRVPDALVDVAVLAEPLSVVEKAVGIALRLHIGEARRAAVLGAGTIGLLAAMVLRERGLEPALVSKEPPDSPRGQLVRDAGFAYNAADRVDIVIEAAGAPEAATAGLEMLSPLGVLVLLGAARSVGELPLLDLIIGNRIIAGSVNAGPHDWRQGLEHLSRFDKGILARMIHRERFDRFRESIGGAPAGAPKVVHVIE